MNRQEARALVGVDWAMCYRVVFDQLDFIKDETAKVRATNGFMITIDKVLPFNAPTEEHDGFTTADKLPRSDKVIPDEHSKPQDAPETMGGEDDAEMFGTDKYGHAWPTYVTCLNELSPGKFCGTRCEVKASSKNPGNIYAICPKCKRFVQRDGKPGREATRA